MAVRGMPPPAGGRSITIPVGGLVGRRRHQVSPQGQPRSLARTPGPDTVSGDFTGWWVYVIGDIVGAAIAVMLIILSPRQAAEQGEREAAEGGDARVP